MTRLRRLGSLLIVALIGIEGHAQAALDGDRLLKENSTCLRIKAATGHVFDIAVSGNEAAEVFDQGEHYTLRVLRDKAMSDGLALIEVVRDARSGVDKQLSELRLAEGDTATIDDLQITLTRSGHACGAPPIAKGR